MYIYFLVVTFILGLAIGSFLNVVIYRLPRKESLISPGSHCTSCGNKLKPIDLVPVFSYLFLKGSCRYCKEKISVRYPLVELATAAAFAGLYLRFDISPELPGALFLTSILIAVFMIDLDKQIIPNELVIAGLAGGALYVLWKTFFCGLGAFGTESWIDNLLGLLPGTLFLLAVALIGMLIYKSRDVMGMGDVKLFAPIGLILGWKMCIAALFISILLGGITSIALILLKIKNRKDMIPFGPFIAAGTYLAMIFGDALLRFYRLI